MSEEAKAAAAPEGLPEEEFSRLLDSIGTMAPLFRSLGGSGEARSPAAAGRENLLLALKPYLSPSRCEAIDYLVRMARISDALRALL